ncbi:uncharacterized protein FN964_008156 [Alca torda]
MLPLKLHSVISEVRAAIRSLCLENYVWKLRPGINLLKKQDKEESKNATDSGEHQGLLEHTAGQTLSAIACDVAGAAQGEPGTRQKPFRGLGLFLTWIIQLSHLQCRTGSDGSTVRGK